MTDLIRQGKVLYWGTSEWSAKDISAAHRIAHERGLEPPIVEQPQYNLFVRSNVEQALAPLCDELGIGLTVWSPLAYGLLTGKYDGGEPEGARLTLAGFDWLRDEIFGARREERLAQARAFSELARE